MDLDVDAASGLQSGPARVCEYLRYKIKEKLLRRNAMGAGRQRVEIPCTLETACLLFKRGGGAEATSSHEGKKLNYTIKCLGHAPVEDEAYDRLRLMLFSRNDGFLRKYHNRIKDPVDKKVKCPVTYVRSNIDSTINDTKMPERAKYKHHIKFRWEARCITDRLPDDTITHTRCGVLVLLFSIEGSEEALAEDQSAPCEYDAGEDVHLAPETEAEQLQQLLLEAHQAHGKKLAEMDKLISVQRKLIDKLTRRNAELCSKPEPYGIRQARIHHQNIRDSLARAEAAHAAMNPPPSSSGGDSKEITGTPSKRTRKRK